MPERDPDNPETDDQATGEEAGDESSTIRQMRETIERLQPEAEEAKNLKREMAFLKAGVDTESKAGQMLLKAYEGELEPDAIRQEAKDIGLPFAGGGTSEGEGEGGETQETAPEREPGEERSTEERTAVAQGTPPDDQNAVNPRDQARRDAERIIEEGGTREDALGEMFGQIAAAGYKEQDERVIYRDGA